MGTRPHVLATTLPQLRSTHRGQSRPLSRAARPQLLPLSILLPCLSAHLVPSSRITIPPHPQARRLGLQTLWASRPGQVREAGRETITRANGGWTLPWPTLGAVAKFSYVISPSPPSQSLGYVLSVLAHFTDEVT